MSTINEERLEALRRAADNDAKYGPPENRQIDITKRNTFIRGASWWRTHGSKPSEEEMIKILTKYSTSLFHTRTEKDTELIVNETIRALQGEEI